MPCTARRASNSRASSRLCPGPAISAFVEVPSSIVFAFDETFATSQLPTTAIEAPAKHFARRGELSSLPAKLLDEVYAAVLDAAQLESWSIEALGTRLQASLPAWNVHLHNTRAPAGHRKPLTPLILPNQFLTATRTAGTSGAGARALAAKTPGHAWGDTQDTLVIDFNFRRHFELPGIASKGYAAALEELPHIFVGHRTQLEALIADVSHLMLREYRAKGMSMPPWRTTQALLSLWSTGHTQPAISTSTRPGQAIARAASEELDTAARTNFPAPPLRARNASMPARVMLGFEVNPEPDSPVSGLVFCPNAVSSRASSDGKDAAPRLYTPGHVGSPEGISGSSGFASLVGSSGGASPLGSSPEEGDHGSLVLRIAQAARTPVRGKQWLV